MQNLLGKATPIGNYVSGPPPASFFLENMKFQKYMGKMPISAF